jgi:RNA polymerase sigma-70 factor (ECF subfamily)
MDRSAPDRFRDLISKAKAGDQAAFGLLYEEWYAPVYRFVLLRVGTPDIAEDLVQDVFMKVFSHLDRFELRAAHPLGFLFTTARNTIIDHHKKKKTERLDEDTAGNIRDDMSPSPEAHAALALDVVQLQGALKHLTQEQQDVVALRFMEGRSVKEVSLIMGKGEEAVRQMQVRALRSLRAYFADKGLL